MYRRAFVNNNGRKMGYINSVGELVIPPIYYGGFDFSENCGVVVFEDKLMSVIDINNNVICNNKFEHILPQSNRFSVYKHGYCKGYLKDLKVYGIPRYKKAYNFSCGMACAVEKEDPSWQINIIDDNLNKIAVSYSPNFFIASEWLMPCCSKDEKFGFIDITGRYVINPKYDYVGTFCNGRAAIYMEKPRKCGILNNKHDIKWLPKNIYDICLYGDCIIYTSYDDKTKKYFQGILGNDLELITEPRFFLISKFCNGIACAQSNNSKWGLINIYGEWVVEPIYELLDDIKYNTVYFKNENKYGYINLQGDIIWKDFLGE